MKILVTGGAGFIGSALIREAIAQGHDILNVDKLTYAANPGSLRSVENMPAYQFSQTDICDAAALRPLFDAFTPDAVMHLAAESHVDRSIDAPSDFVQTNIGGTFTLLQAARDYHASLGTEQKNTFRFHHISTDEVYGDLSKDAPAFTEATPYNPSSPYAASKAASDHLVRAWGRTYGVPVLISNCSNNYGPFQFPEKLIPVIISKAFAGEKIPIYGTGENVRDWLHVDDHACALLAVLEKGIIGETYNIGGENERANIDLVADICAIMDIRRPSGAPHSCLISFVDDRPGHDHRYAIDSSKVQTTLGWAPKYDLRSGLEQTVDWYLDNQDEWQGLLKQPGAGARLGLGAGQGKVAS